MPACLCSWMPHQPAHSPERNTDALGGKPHSLVQLGDAQYLVGAGALGAPPASNGERLQVVHVAVEQVGQLAVLGAHLGLRYGQAPDGF